MTPTEPWRAAQLSSTEKSLVCLVHSVGHQVPSIPQHKLPRFRARSPSSVPPCRAAAVGLAWIAVLSSITWLRVWIPSSASLLTSCVTLRNLYFNKLSNVSLTHSWLLHVACLHSTHTGLPPRPSHMQGPPAASAVPFFQTLQRQPVIFPNGNRKCHLSFLTTLWHCTALRIKAKCSTYKLPIPFSTFIYHHFPPPCAAIKLSSRSSSNAGFMTAEATSGLAHRSVPAPRGAPGRWCSQRQQLTFIEPGLCLRYCAKMLFIISP